mmetsp:Transcript_12812/g.26139  ORF Transcript_12812/g.26139 Transcript_12812/m.26139 type:complete len:205 (-) Transcript_12812:56-670(-)
MWVSRTLVVGLFVKDNIDIIDALSSLLPSPSITSLISVNPSFSMCKLVSMVKLLNMFPLLHASTFSESAGGRDEDRLVKSSDTVVPLPTPEKPTMVTRRPRVGEGGGSDDIIIVATSSGVFPSTSITVVPSLLLSPSLKTPSSMLLEIPALSIWPSSASRVFMDCDSEEEKVWKVGSDERREITAVEATEPPLRRMEDNDIRVE